MRNANPVRRLAARNIGIMVALTLLVTFMCMPLTAFAAREGAGGGYPSCVTTSSGSSTTVDITTCLPSGRWGNYIGVLTSRIEPSEGIIGFVANLPAMITHTFRNVLPNMLLMVTQLCWSTALSLSQFAASFNPLDAAGAQIDAQTAKLIGDLLTGGVAATIAVVGIVVWLMAAAFDVWGGAKVVTKRIISMVLCFAALIILSNGAAKTGEGATSPATGSPWWVVRTINDTVNKLAVSTNLDGLNDSNSNMMAYDNPDGQLQTCQDYLYAMHQQYNSAATTASSQNSNVTSAVNRLWEETALRSWVTMQWGNPQVSDPTAVKSGETDYVAQNARMAYCHILDMQANTNPKTQKELTNAQMGTSINQNTANWIFTENGWISTLHSLVDDGKDQDDRDPYVMQTRAGVFWETCGSTGGGAISARDGWSTLITNLGDDGTKEIKNAGKKVRVGAPSMTQGASVGDVMPTNKDSLMSTDTTTVCKVVLEAGGGDDEGKNGVFNRKESGYGLEGKKQRDTDLGDAATLGWRFDVPNLGATWRQANIGDTNDPSTVTGAVKTTLDYLYGNNDVDSLTALGSVIGGICNLIVWGLFSIILIISKIMLLMMCMFLAFAFLVRAVPVGEKPKKVLGNWAKYCGSLCMTGVLYSAIASLATFICQLALNVCSGMPSTFLYNIISALSPALALIVLGMFCSKVLKIGNPFSFKALMGIAGSGMLVAGAAKAVGGGIRFVGRHGINGVKNLINGRNRKGSGRISTRGDGHGSTTDSEEVLNKTLEPASTETKPGETKDGKPPIIPPEGSRAAKWAQLSPDTVRGSLAQTAAVNGARWHKLGDEIEKNKNADKWMANVERYKGMGLTDNQAEKLADMKSTFMALTPKTMAKAAGNTLLSAGSFAKAAVQSAPLRDVVGRGAKVAATAGLTALAFANPLTMPLGMMGAASLALNRDVWHGAATGFRAAAGAAQHAWTNRSGIAANAAGIARFAGHNLSNAAHAAGSANQWLRSHSATVTNAENFIGSKAQAFGQFASTTASNFRSGVSNAVRWAGGTTFGQKAQQAGRAVGDFAGNVAHAAAQVPDMTVGEAMHKAANAATSAAAAGWNAIHHAEMDSYIDDSGKLHNNPFVPNPGVAGGMIPQPAGGNPFTTGGGAGGETPTGMPAPAASAQPTTPQPVPAQTPAPTPTPTAPDLSRWQQAAIPGNVDRKTFNEVLENKYGELVNGGLSPERIQKEMDSYAKSEKAFEAARNLKNMKDINW